MDQQSGNEERLLQEIRWYGKTIAGGGPMGGYERAAKQAERRWYAVTLPLLNQMKAVYGQTSMAGCLKCHGQGFTASSTVCSDCGGIGMVAADSQPVESGK